jgi:hypothetical protein
MKGQDPQLEKAVELAMQDIRLQREQSASASARLTGLCEGVKARLLWMGAQMANWPGRLN